MKLKFAAEVGRDSIETSFWWECENWNDCYASAHGEIIAAPEYDWLYSCEGIPGEHMKDWPGLLTEYIDKFCLMPKSYRVKYLGVARKAVSVAGGSIWSLSV